MDESANLSSFDMKDLKASMVECTKIFSDCTKMNSDNIIIREQIKNLFKLRLRFQDFAENSVDHGIKLSSYIVNFKGVVDLIDDPTIHKEDFIEELKSLEDETKEYKTVSENLFRSIKGFIDQFSASNKYIESYMDGIKKEIGKIEDNLNEIKNSKQRQVKLYEEKKFWEGLFIVATTGLAIAIAPGAGLAIGIANLISTSIKDDHDLNYETLINIANELIESLDESKEEKTELTKDLSALFEGFAKIAVTFVKFQLFWNSQKETLSKILQNLDNVEKINRINTLKVKLIGKQLDQLKSSVFDYNNTVLEIITYDRMI
ncbi:11020_t:CDS:2 [Scutellospora calospora]|uniref:11020_t:CDS:1 n=1 Tax=Scutellospora calospora TaxID=85575 RepID=A0ACA9JXR9_9GLOM|nr:11020_t:CDS:2 [Scutellospora calospora]